MKVFFESNDRKAIKSEHQHYAKLEGQMVVIDCTDKEQVIRLDLYRKGETTYYCCLWIDKNEFCIRGSESAKNSFGAAYAALDSAGISFDTPLPHTHKYDNHKVLDKLEHFMVAIAQNIGVNNSYTHNVFRSN
jgi:hypothetical protein